MSLDLLPATEEEQAVQLYNDRIKFWLSHLERHDLKVVECVAKELAKQTKSYSEWLEKNS
jgi:hypothetical protein